MLLKDRIGDCVVVRTPTIEKYCKENVKAVIEADKSFRRTRDLWKTAYVSQDIAQIELLAKERDKAIKNLTKVSREADKFLIGLHGLWEIKY